MKETGQEDVNVELKKKKKEGRIHVNKFSWCLSSKCCLVYYDAGDETRFKGP